MPPWNRRPARRARSGGDPQDIPGTHLGELWDLAPTGNRVELEFIDIFRLRDGRLIEHWTSMDINALRQQMRPEARG
jgi:SnoaL-like polyketide cyclase